MPSYGLPSARAEASRRNGAKSRGPKTSQGKVRSSQNALKHGLRAQKHMVLPDEDAAEFAALETALIDELAPDGVLQTLLVKRVAAAAWRMSRAERIEVEIFAENALPDGGPGLSMIRDANRARAFETLVRYRGGTLAEFWRSLRTLKALQSEALSRAEAAAPPGHRKAAGAAGPTLQAEAARQVAAPPPQAEAAGQVAAARRVAAPKPEEATSQVAAPQTQAAPRTRPMEAMPASATAPQPNEPKPRGLPADLIQPPTQPQQHVGTPEPTQAAISQPPPDAPPLVSADRRPSAPRRSGTALVPPGTA